MSDLPTTPSSSTFTEEAACATCGATFLSTVLMLMGQECRWHRNCAACVISREAEIARMEQSEVRRRQEAREEKWKTICDVEYRTLDEGGNTDPERLARDCPKLSLIIQHERDRGLLLRGKTGLCKTRAVWRLLRICYDEGQTIVALSAGDFRRQYAQAAGTDHNEAAWFDKMVQADCLFLDDLGKAAWTDGVWGCFFELVESRVKKHRKLFVTTNDTGETLATKCKDPSTWEPLERRLRENCQRITL